MKNITGDDSKDDVIPESILSVSKDARYIRQCQELLKQFLTILIDRNKLLTTSVVYSEERKQELRLLRKQTAWMVSCAMYLIISTTVGRTLGMESLGLKFTTWPNASNKAQAYGITTTRLYPSLVVHIPLILAIIWSSVSAVGHDGKSAGSKKNSSSKEGFKLHQQDQESSKGADRRMIYERLRQQMIDRAAKSNSAHADLDLRSFNQQAHQQTETRRDDISTLERAMSLSPSNFFLHLTRRLTKFIFELSSNLNGPHRVQFDSNRDNNNSDHRGASPYSISIWIVRLHLASFLLTGKYPTLIHRLFGLKSMREISDDDKRNITILDRPNTNRVMAILILLQASTSMFQYVSSQFAKRVAKYLDISASTCHRTECSANQFQFSKARFRDHLNKFFGNNPCKSLEDDSSVKETEMTTRSKRSYKKTKIVCTICRLERMNPVVPSSCGHVVCWNCLNQWISKVRPECPICRAPCNANDILPLYDYEPAL